MLPVQAQKKRRETWAGGALSKLADDSDDDMAQDLMPFRAHSRHTGLWQNVMLWKDCIRHIVLVTDNKYTEPVAWIFNKYTEPIAWIFQK